MEAFRHGAGQPDGLVRVDEYARQWGVQRVQRVLDVAFAWSVMNSHFDVAEFLLAHGADIKHRLELP